MKIGVSSYSFAHHMANTGANYTDICKIAKELGFDGIEFIDLDVKVQPADSIEDLAKGFARIAKALNCRSSPTPWARIFSPVKMKRSES
jgi:hypothetical protein